MRKGIMALENLEVETPPVVDDVPLVEADVTAFVTAPETDMLEVTEAAAEVAEIEENITEAADTAETIETMAESVEATVETGGMSEPEAEAVRVAVEHMCTRLGFPKSTKVFPAMEGFGDKKTRIQATKIALENMEAKVKEIWAAIVATFKKAAAWIKEFFAHLTDWSKGIAKRAEDLGKAAAAKAGKSAADGATVKITGATGGFGKVLHIGGTVPEGKAFATAVGEFVTTAAEVGNKQATLTLEGQKALSGMLGAIDNEGFEGKVADFVKTFSDSAVGPVSTGGKDLGGEGLAVHEAKLGFGDKAFFTVTITDSAKAADLANSIQSVLGDATGGKELDEKQQTVAPLSTDDIIAVSKAVKAHMDSYKDFSAQIKAVDAAVKDIEAKAAAVVKAAGKTDGGKAGTNSGAAIKLARKYMSATTNGAATLRKYDMTVCGAALKYCAASLKAIGADVPAEKETAAAAAA